MRRMSAMFYNAVDQDQVGLLPRSIEPSSPRQTGERAIPRGHLQGLGRSGGRLT
jgi:hypothetical protein